ncbi:MAG: metalloregulator ArsR/SmtB family transcription factor [Acidimicrobiia bacterium]|nr:metalloregulator ArsR/SmtB family transcription factor [Acidimicrobiia bacterium]
MDGLINRRITDQLATLADPIRDRLLLLLERQELTVSELCAVTQLPQSTVSRHLKALGDSGWVTARTEGTSHRYAMARSVVVSPPDRKDASAHRLWQLVREQVTGTASAAHDLRRLERILARRRARSREFFSSAATEWDRLRDELFGKHVFVSAFAVLAGAEAVVGDLGCGTGQIAACLAPFVRRVIAVDASTEMLQAAQQRVAGSSNVELRRGELEALPIDDARLDLAFVTLVLHHVADPGAVLAEVARVLQPGGRLVVVDMLPHDRDAYRQQMGHVWLGFSEDQVATWLIDVGFEDCRIVPLAADPRAKGPGLFAASARTSPAVTARPRPSRAEDWKTQKETTWQP